MSCETIENLKQSCIDSVMMYTDQDIIEGWDLPHDISAERLDAFRDRLIDELFETRLEQAA
jgi:hypothetical protein